MSEEPELVDAPLSADQILGFTAEPFPVKAFGGVVYVQPLSGKDRDKYESQNLVQTRGGQTKLNLTNARARLAQMCLVERDENGAWRRMFRKDQVDMLGQLPAAELDRVTEAAREASGLDGEEEDALVESFDEAIPARVGGRSSSDLQAISG